MISAWGWLEKILYVSKQVWWSTFPAMVHQVYTGVPAKRLAGRKILYILTKILKGGQGQQSVDFRFSLLGWAIAWNVCKCIECLHVNMYSLMHMYEHVCKYLCDSSIWPSWRRSYIGWSTFLVICLNFSDNVWKTGLWGEIWSSIEFLCVF
jgi:hypothetical protein